MEDGTRSIVELAWARELGLPDDAFFGTDETDLQGRLTREDAAVVTFVRLWDHRVLVGPAGLLARSAEVDDQTLASGAGLLGLAAVSGHGSPRLLREVVLGFTDAYVEDEALETAVVSDDPPALADLQRECPPDDVTEVGLASMTQRFVLLDDRDAPTSGAGYEEWQGILADLGVLTPPALRQDGHGTVVGALAVNDALDAGLVPQWRTRTTNLPAMALGKRLGFRPAGTQTTVVFS